MTTISFRIEESKVEQLEAIAESMDRNRSYVINQAINHFIEYQNEIRERTQQGIDDIEAGRTISLDDFNKEMEQLMADTREFMAKRNKKSNSGSVKTSKRRAG